MGDFNGKVGEKRENVIGPYGMEERNDNGELLTDFCKKRSCSS